MKMIRLMLLLTGALMPALSPAADWTGVSQEAVQGGLQQEHADALLKQAREAGYSADETALLLRPALAARQQNLPARPILDKLDEGLVKQVPAATLTQACETRFHHLQKAAQLSEPLGTQSGRVLYSVTLALESGLSESMLQAVLKEGRSKSPGQIQAALEAGESMYLNGLDEPSVQALMTDCLQRNLRRSEVLRTTRYACQQHRAGMQGGTIRQTLWGRGACDGTGPHRPPPAGNGGGNGQGPGGPGRGAGLPSESSSAPTEAPTGQPDHLHGQEGMGGPR